MLYMAWHACMHSCHGGPPTAWDRPPIRPSRTFPPCTPTLVQVQGLAVGDWVVPLAPALGTWRERGTFNAADWHVVPDKAIGLAAAATLAIKCVRA